MFFTEKYNSEGIFLKLKSGMVAMGSEQDRGHLAMDVSSQLCQVQLFILYVQ